MLRGAFSAALRRAVCCTFSPFVKWQSVLSFMILSSVLQHAENNGVCVGNFIGYRLSPTGDAIMVDAGHAAAAAACSAASTARYQSKRAWTRFYINALIHKHMFDFPARRDAARIANDS